MRICIIGKYPPIQGGVSMRTYWDADGLAARGHEVHVVTNAREVRPPFRMHMRAEDWERCEARRQPGSVSVHWTDPVDRSQAYIPMASPFVSKLAGVAAGVHARLPFDVIYSRYLEPYGVAGHLAAQMARVPHVVRMAGSDAGRLWHHPQLEALYDHVLQSAEIVIAAGTVADRAMQRGVAPDRIAPVGDPVLPEHVFSPNGPRLDPAALRAEVEPDAELRDAMWGNFAADRPFFGVCGKLDESKGSFSLLAAVDRLKRNGLEVGLVALAHGRPDVERGFRVRVQELDLTDRVLQLPFLPHWRVPEFLRSCLAVCCLEQDFPIRFHTPIVAREVLLCGACLIASTEVIRKLPAYGRLPHGYGCVAVEDVNDIERLSDQLAAVVRDPSPIKAVGARGHRFARELQRDAAFPQRLEDILGHAAAGNRGSSTMDWRTDNATAEERPNRFPFTRLAAAAIGNARRRRNAKQAPAQLDADSDLQLAQSVLPALESQIDKGKTDLRPLLAAVQAEVAVAAAERDADTDGREQDPLFRLRIRRWAMLDDDLAGLVPVRDPRSRIVEFDYDVSEFATARTPVQLPVSVTPRDSYVVVFGCSNGERRAPLLVDRTTARLLELCDGTRTAAQVVERLEQEDAAPTCGDNLRWIENLFVCGLLRLEDSVADTALGRIRLRAGE